MTNGIAMRVSNERLKKLAESSNSAGVEFCNILADLQDARKVISEIQKHVDSRLDYVNDELKKVNDSLKSVQKDYRVKRSEKLKNAISGEKGSLRQIQAVLSKFL